MSIVFFAVNVAVFFFIADQLVWKQKLPEPKKTPDFEPQAGKTPEPIVSTPFVGPNLELVKPQWPMAQQQPQKARSLAKIYVHLDGFGHWAQLVDISNVGVRLKNIGATYPDMEGRELELALQQDLVLRVKFTRRIESEYHFDHIGLSKDKVSLLNQWILRKAV